MRLTAATILTLLRLFLILPILLLLPSYPVLALILLVIALLTDYADGLVARKTNTITRLGTFLDHFADKVLVHVVLLYFVAYHNLSALAFGTFLIRDFLVLGLRHIATQRGKEISSMSLGKIKFVGQSLLLILLVLTLIFSDGWITIVTQIVLWVSVALAVLSAAQIVTKGWPSLKE